MGAEKKSMNVEKHAFFSLKRLGSLVLILIALFCLTGFTTQPAVHQANSRVCFSTLGMVAGVEKDDKESCIAFVSIAQGTASRIVDPLEIVIESEQEWQKLWERHALSGSAAPPVDFATQVVVGIFAGERPTAGYKVQIIKVECEKTRITVTYEVKTPLKDALVAQVLTQPFHLIRLPRLNLPIQFRKEDVDA